MITKKLTRGRYLYYHWVLIRQGYHSPDKRVVWEALNVTNEHTDAHGYSKKELIKRLDSLIQSYKSRAYIADKEGVMMLDKNWVIKFKKMSEQAVENYKETIQTYTK